MTARRAAASNTWCDLRLRAAQGTSLTRTGVGTRKDMHAAPKPTLRTGRTALHDAAKRNSGNVARALLQAGAHPDARSGDGVTPLHETALSNAVEVARALLDAGADVDAREEEEMTPLHFAAYSESLAVLALLVSRGADINAHYGHHAYGRITPVTMAAGHGSVAAVRALLALGADMDAGYTTPLHTAAGNGHAHFGRARTAEPRRRLVGASPWHVGGSNGAAKWP
jgi:ankyrin repeat protein